MWTTRSSSIQSTPPERAVIEVTLEVEFPSDVLGRIYPNQCRLYGLACTPRTPIGPCMVSDEGACRIWWADGVRENAWEGRKTPAAPAEA